MASSEDLFRRACEVMPGGVNSPVRAFGSVGGIPRFVASSQGCHLHDVDGRRYVDYVMSWGPLPLGHAHPEILAAAEHALRRGSSFGAPTEAEVELAEVVADRVPGVDMLRCVSSGTEAAMTALRLARAATGRTRIVKFAGHYHGHSDALLVSAGSGVATLGLPDSPGVTPGAASDTIVVAWNDAAGIEQAFSEHGEEIAAVICEPIAANMGLVPPAPRFLPLLRDLTRRHGAMLVFDEVITGFRVAPGGATALTGVVPDLVVLGKILGGGFPLAAVGGGALLMSQLAPAGAVYQAGTLSGNPVAVAAGLAQLRLLDEAAYRGLEERVTMLAAGLTSVFGGADVPVRLPVVHSLAGVFFSTQPVSDYETAKQADHDRYARFFHGMLERGHYLPPSGYEALFVSLAHGREDIEATIAAAAEVAGEL